MQPAPPPPPTGGNAYTNCYSYAPPAAAERRQIKPDGFHTSDNDPALQQKYGHVQQTYQTAAPPPMAAAAVPAQAPARGAPGAPGAPPPQVRRRSE